MDDVQDFWANFICSYSKHKGGYIIEFKYINRVLIMPNGLFQHLYHSL